MRTTIVCELADKRDRDCMLVRYMPCGVMISTLLLALSDPASMVFRHDDRILSIEIDLAPRPARTTPKTGWRG